MSGRVVWLTDIHLNFVDRPQVLSFLDKVNAQGADAVVITGDIAEARDLLEYLQLIENKISAPVYFVLGNHDFYFGSLATVRQQVTEFCQAHPKLVWLQNAGLVQLSTNVGLFGHDGWADGRLGDFERSTVMLNDYTLIKELSGHSKQARWEVLKKLGDDAAASVRQVLPRALEAYSQVVFLTHVPPFREACWYNGQISNDEWLPHFTCRAVGTVLSEIVRDYPHRKLTVLCGHTHGRGECYPLPNLHVMTGGAEYGSPVIERLLQLG